MSQQVVDEHTDTPSRQTRDQAHLVHDGKGECGQRPAARHLTELKAIKLPVVDLGKHCKDLQVENNHTKPASGRVCHSPKAEGMESADRGPGRRTPAGAVTISGSLSIFTQE